MAIYKSTMQLNNTLERYLPAPVLANVQEYIRENMKAVETEWYKIGLAAGKKMSHRELVHDTSIGRVFYTSQVPYTYEAFTPETDKCDSFMHIKDAIDWLKHEQTMVGQKLHWDALIGLLKKAHDQMLMDGLGDGCKVFKEIGKFLLDR